MKTLIYSAGPPVKLYAHRFHQAGKGVTIRDSQHPQCNSSFLALMTNCDIMVKISCQDKPAKEDYKCSTAASAQVHIFITCFCANYSLWKCRPWSKKKVRISP